MSAIEVKNISKRFNIRKGINNGSNGLLERLKIKSPEKKAIWALEDVSFKVEGGEWLGIVGENGSGKTTLLKIIGNVMESTSGEIKTNGKIVSILGLGTGFKDELTARENVYLYSSLMGLSKNEIEERYEDVVSFSGLYDYMNVKFKKFSDGMKMRLAFSTAMNVEADIFLSDEVLTVGDGEFQKKCLKKMEEFKENNKTIIFVSHSLSSIKKWCDRAIFLDEGRIREKGNVDEVLEKYREFLKWKGKNEKLRGFKNKIDSRNIKDLTFFNSNRKESYIFNKCEYFGGEVFLDSKYDKMKFKFIDDKTDEEKLIIHTKNIKKVKDNYVYKFEIKDLWLDEGQYKVVLEVDDEILCELNIQVVESGCEKPNLIVLKDPENDEEFPRGKFFVFGSDEKIKKKYNDGFSVPIYKKIGDISDLKEKFDKANILE